MESHIGSGMKGIPQITNVKTLLVIVLDGFNGGVMCLFIVNKKKRNSKEKKYKIKKNR